MLWYDAVVCKWFHFLIDKKQRKKGSEHCNVFDRIKYRNRMREHMHTTPLNCHTDFLQRNLIVFSSCVGSGLLLGMHIYYQVFLLAVYEIAILFFSFLFRKSNCSVATQFNVYVTPFDLLSNVLRRCHRCCCCCCCCRLSMNGSRRFFII